MALPRAFVVFDTETTGMPPGGRLVEIGAVKVRGDHVVDRFERLVFPECPIPPEVSAIHGIEDRMVADADTADRVLPDFLAWAGRGPLFAHNVDFDARILAAEAARHGMDLPEVPTYCTLHAARRLLKRRSHSLPHLVADLGLAPAAHHRALADAEHALHLYWEMRRVMGDALRLRDFGRGRTLDGYALDPVRLSARHAVLADAVAAEEAVDLRYRTAHGRVVETRVTPRLLYRRGSKAWMEALCHHSCFFKSYRLDRVEGARACPGAAPVAARRP